MNNLFSQFSIRVVLVKTADWKTIIEADYPKAAQLAYSSKGTYLMVYEPFMSKYKIIYLCLKYKYYFVVRYRIVYSYFTIK